MSVYVTPTYTYQGDFRKGKKSGIGILIKKTFYKKGNSKNQYVSEERHEGIWKDDELISEQLIEIDTLKNDI